MAYARGGGVQTKSKEDAEEMQQNLRKKGIESTMEQKIDGDFVLRFPLRMGQLANIDKIVQSVKQVDEADMKFDHSIDARIVEIDTKIAKQQVDNVTVSYIDNMIAPELGMNKIDGKVTDLQKMSEYFQSSTSATTGSKGSKQSISQKELGADNVEKWWFQQTSTLKQKVEAQFVNFEEEYELIAINLLYNSKQAVKFIQHKGYENSVLMFHGAKRQDMGSIFQTGFQDFPGKSIGKLYGNGHYFTPQALHAIRYLEKCKGYRRKQQFWLIAAMVNCGKTKTVQGYEAKNKPIAEGFDSNYARVTDGVHQVGTVGIGWPLQEHPNYTGHAMDEYAIRDGSRILPRFFITLRRCEKVFIWRDKNIANRFNGSVLEELKASTAIYGVTETKTALELIARKMKCKHHKVYVITNGGDDGEGFVRKVRNELKLETDILVFCGAVDWHSKWAQKYQNVEVKCGKKYIVSFITRH